MSLARNRFTQARTLKIPTPTTAAPRRQARFIAEQVIVPAGLCPRTWYDIASGRRRDDERPGMVLLDVAGSRMHVPARCLEFRNSPDAVRTRRSPLPEIARRLSTVSSPRMAVAASLVPVGLLAILAISRDSAR